MCIKKQLEELQLKETYLEVINSFAVILVNAQSIDDIVWGVTENAIAKLNYVDCIIYLYDEKDDKLIQRAAYGPKNPKHQSIKNPIKIIPGKGIVGEVFITGVGEIISDTSKDSRYIVDDEKRLSEITIPIVSVGRVIGVIDSEHPDRDFFNEQDFKMLSTVAAMVATKLEQALANEELKEYQQNLERLINEQTDKLEQKNIELSTRNNELEHATSELNNALLQEQHMRKMKSHFVSVTSHQFRTPLAIIQSNSDLLNFIADESEAKTKERLKRYTGYISKEIVRMTELMDDVLVLGKVSAGKMTVLKTKQNINHLINEIAAQFNEIQSDDRTLEIESNGLQRDVQIDIKLMHHSLTNIVSNAFKYSKSKNPQISINYRASVVSISIQDFGIGIPNEELVNLFQPFHRAKNAVGVPGSGLGLAIAKDYIELNGGTITVESKLNEGSCFLINIPYSLPSYRAKNNI